MQRKLTRSAKRGALDAIALKVPRQVPIETMFSFFPTRYAGFTVQEVMYDPEKLLSAQMKALLDFQPDMDQNPFGLRFLGPVLDILDFKQLKWPGHGMSADHTYQFIEGEYMKADEYDHFLSDPSDYMIRKHWPRICGAWKGFGMIPSPHNFITYYMGIPFGLAAFAQPEVIESLELTIKAAKEAVRVATYTRIYTEKAKEAGFPMQFGGFTQAPFDTLGDFFRGTRGLMLDMYRRPDMVLRACDKLLPIMFDMAMNSTRNSGNPRVFIPVHKGVDGFMSSDQFKKFFWPSFNELMLALIREGCIPCPLWEGNCTSRLEIIKGLPAGKACYAFEATDMFKAKAVLGDRISIRGAVPLSILVAGTPDEVRAYCKKLIDVCGRDGGYIMDASTSLDDARAENVKAMFDATLEYGVY